jgi:hypothetical protein
MLAYIPFIIIIQILEQTFYTLFSFFCTDSVVYRELTVVRTAEIERTLT